MGAREDENAEALGIARHDVQPSVFAKDNPSGSCANTAVAIGAPFDQGVLRFRGSLLFSQLLMGEEFHHYILKLQ
jgi:hypothetical protein